jgi:antitoxin MazE
VSAKGRATIDRAATAKGFAKWDANDGRQLDCSPSLDTARRICTLDRRRSECIFIVSTTPERPKMPTIQKWGNSLAVRIPAGLATQVNLREGTPVDVIAEQGAIVVVPRSGKKYRLTDLLSDCKPSQLHGETDFGPDVGREVLD